ncbi:uncharacterized protein LOC125240024 isoform X1 [Leguminivora glycinivorella]|uniref:uncharacterized protein LOC125240024 isoform X1 n=1 Tax=Leguminivora glycinivorella TaxID=1035111 RepID=UPI00200E2A9C|nr:uncharacterized protein LOC125240024 isoform X1 [Leguminivora glycinivorella]
MATSFYILLAAAFCRFVDSTDNIAYSPIIQKIQNDVFQVKTDIATAMTTIDVKLKDIAVRLDTIESRVSALEDSFIQVYDVKKSIRDFIDSRRSAVSAPKTVRRRVEGTTYKPGVSRKNALQWGPLGIKIEGVSESDRHGDINLYTSPSSPSLNAEGSTGSLSTDKDARDEQQLAKTAAFQKRMNQTDQECSHLNNHAYIACYFKGLGVISRSGVYVVSAGAQLLAAECDRLRPKEVEGIAKDCNSVNDEPDLSSARRAELLLLCVAHKVDPDVCNIPIPSYNGKETTID